MRQIWRNLALATAYFWGTAGLGLGLTLNELMPINDTTLQDEAGEYDDWFEIYNETGAAVSLLGYRASDDRDDPGGWAFPDTVIEAGAFMLVWADNDVEQGPLHADFKISGNGEGLYLRFDQAHVDSVAFGPAGADSAYARLPDGSGDWRWTLDATPGITNEGTGIGGGEAPLPSGANVLVLGAAAPNPFNPHTAIPVNVQVDLPWLEVRAYDPAGRLVQTLHAGPAAAGILRLVWNAGALPSGVYLIRAETGAQVQTRRVVLLK